jgi:translation elongation factor EF-Tu-like GTPase
VNAEASVRCSPAAPRRSVSRYGLSMSSTGPARATVTVELLSTERGGRTSGGITSGYRALARFEASELDYGFELALDEPPLAPGTEGTGVLRLWAPGAETELEVGARFEIREGAHVVGRGHITGCEPD